MNQHFKLTTQNYDECIETNKNIIWMYQDMIRTYGGFGLNIDFETVNYEKFIFTEIADEQMNVFFHEVQTLKQGSLVALCCEVYDLLNGARRNEGVTNFIKSLTTASEMNQRPFDREVLSLMLQALEEEPHYEWASLEFGSCFSKKLDEVYNQYVLNYFKSMFEQGKRRGCPESQ